MKTKYPGIYTRSLKDGTTVYDVIASVGGKQRISRGHKTLALARAALDVLRHDMQKGRGGGAASPRMTLAEFLEERWLPYAESNLRSPESVRAYRRNVRQLVEASEQIEKASGQVLRLKTLKPLEIEEIKRQLVGAHGRSAASQAYARLSQSMKDGQMWELIDRNPCERLKRIEEPKRDQPVLSIETLARIIDEADKTPYGALIYITMLTGLRWGEVTGLLWSDVDFAASVLRVRRPDTKSDAGARAVWLGPDTIERLQEHRFAQMQRFVSLGAEPRKLVFTSPMGMRLNDRHFRATVWYPIRSAAGVPALHFHDLRHAQATLLARAGVHPRIAQERLGHARVETTMGVYTQVSAFDQQAGAEAIEGFLRKR